MAIFGHIQNVKKKQKTSVREMALHLVQLKLNLWIKKQNYPVWVIWKV